MDLVRQIVIGSEARNKKLLSVANFTGLLISKGKYNFAEEQLMELFRYCSTPGGSAIWIEPQNRHAVRPKTGLFARIKGFIAKHLPLFGFVEAEEAAPDSIASTHARFRLSLRSADTSIARLAVLPIRLEPQPTAKP